MKASAADRAQRLLAKTIEARGTEERRARANIAAGQPPGGDLNTAAAEKRDQRVLARLDRPD